MDEASPEVDRAESGPRSPMEPRGYCWIPTMDVEPGMVLAKQVVEGGGGHAIILLAVGSEITANTIAQLINKGIECVAVRQAVTAESVALYAENLKAYTARLDEIFGENPDAPCQALRAALIQDGPCQCSI